ncbi:SRPBCC family protein [Algoriphagus sp. D3-2-R+10]|uniref:SRPBCC family protein n=1 Tax=Algoriphagus aurantiacus TaxID=3103948 RepID=UPI002B3C3DA3|nr:SRPBCC family protein [Algoriphagus sp. D3-2-R+10]MEB2775124.1 SRPBCC family protein [Algoriphagus sp. D3-2-R+10]
MSNPTETPKKIGHEYVQYDEDRIAYDMLQEFEAQVTRMYKDKKMLRQVHTKMHGCVKATFSVERDLPEELRVGVFAGEPKDYNAWVRFSNGNTVPQKDRKKDIRGVAIKLLGVPGEKILEDEILAETQDFLLMSSETFFAKTIKELSKLLKAITSSNFIKSKLFILNPFLWPIIMRATKSKVACENPLEIPYWSTQPYQFGTTDCAVKYHLRPSPSNTIVVENTTDYNYLRYNLAQTLHDNEAKFDFFVQFQTDAEAMPIEDPTVAWSSQYIKVATLTIYAQVFDSNAQIEFGDNLSFNPWHSLPVHRPLGAFNRVRKRVYEDMSKFRHDKNKLPSVEPKDSPDFLNDIRSSNTKVTIDQQVPSKHILFTTAEVIINCDKETAYKFVSSVDKLSSWLLKTGPIYGVIKVSTLRGHWEKVGDNRLVERGDSATLVEELISVHPYSNYSYQTTDFSDIFKHFTKKTYGHMWFDTVDDQTRLRWVYTFTYKNLLSRIFLSLFVPLFLKKYLQNGLNNAKAFLED